MCTEKKCTCISSVSHIMAQQIKKYMQTKQWIREIWKSNRKVSLLLVQHMQLPKEHIHQINVQNILTFYWKPLFLAQKSDTSFQSGSRAKTGRFEGLYSYEHVVTGLVRIPNTLVQACLNPERCMMQYCIILLMCRICTTELIWVKKNNNDKILSIING